MSQLPTQGQPAAAGVRRALLLVVIGLVIALVVGAGIGAVLLTRQPDTDLGSAVVPTTPVATDPPREPVSTRVGVFRGTDPQGARAFGRWLGRPVDYVVDFSSRDTWREISDPQYMLDAWEGTGFRPVYAVAMLPVQDASATIERGAAGDYDRYFTRLGRELVAADQQDAVLRIGWEFNLAESRWATEDNAAWVRYWRRIVTAMRAVKGQQFEFDWNPNNGTNPYDAVDYYPGDDVVDYIGVDAYDVAYTRQTYPYPDPCDQTCRRQRQERAWGTAIYGGPRGLEFWSRFAARHGKPLSLPEWGLWDRLDGHGGGENTYYLDRMHEFITDPANAVAYHAYFEFSGPDGPHRIMPGEDFPVRESISGGCSAGPEACAWVAREPWDPGESPGAGPQEF